MPWLFPKLTWRIATKQKELYLTFDDGPIPGPTEFVLQTLERYQAKATFFCIGDNIRKHPDVFQKIVNAGHGVGNHTFHHLRGWGTSTEKYVDNVNQCADEMAKHLSAHQSLFRPPYGRIRGKQIQHLKDEYQIIMWDVLTSDYSQSLTPENCLKGSIRASRPGSVVVFHDSLKAERNMTYALPRYLDHFSKLGYQFKALPVNSRAITNL
ncbi:MAG: polysaccharide deacetylase family protein [Flavobacteriales bacterium]